MTTMPITIQERIPMPVTGTAVPASAASALSVGDLLRILRQRVFLILFIWFMLSGLTVAGTYYWDKYYPSYKASSAVQVESPYPRVPQQLEQPLIQVELLNRYVADQMVAIKADAVLQDAIKSADVRATQWYREADEKEGPEGMLEELQEDLSVSQVPNTNFILVSFATRNKEDAPRIVNAVVSRYLADVEQKSKLQYGLDLEHYKQKEAELERRLTLNRNERLDLITRMPTPGVTEGLNVIGETFRTLATEAARLESDKLMYRAQWENLRGMAVEQMLLSPTQQQMIQEDPMVYNLTASLLGLQQEKQTLLQRVGPKHRTVQVYEAQLESIKTQLDEVLARKQQEVRNYQMSAAETLYLNAAQAKVELEEQLMREQARQQDIDRKLAEYRAKEEEHDRLEEQYNQLSAFNRQLEMMIRDRGMVRVRQYGQALEPREKHLPRWAINVPVGSFLGLLFGVGLALLLELVDTSIKTPRDIGRHVHVPILGTIPDVDDEEVHIDQVELASLTAPRSMVAEAFRTVRTNLQLSSPAERQRTVLISSARPEEGRTTVAVNLAVSIAQSGRRILLVDANFHRPALQQFFPKVPRDGLSNILIGRGNLTDLVTSTDLPNLDVLGSGPIPPNPTELLAGTYLREMIARAQERYDQIIFDGPPILLVSDALVLAGAVDGVILVCRAKLTSRGVAMRGREQLERVNGRIFGAVLNAAQVARGGYYREQIRTYYEYQPEEALTAARPPSLPKQDDDESGPKT